VENSEYNYISQNASSQNELHTSEVHFTMIELVNSLNPLIHLSVDPVRQSEDLQLGTGAGLCTLLPPPPLRAVHYVNLTVLLQEDPSLLAAFFHNLHSCTLVLKKVARFEEMTQRRV
jgi:hypothetical protein